jgi:hypothetical protein
MSKHRRAAVYVGKTTRTPSPSPCLNCGKEIDAGTGVGTMRKPRAGAIAICFYCGDIAAFDSALHLRPLTDEEIIAVAGDERIITLQKALAAKRATKPFAH